MNLKELEAMQQFLIHMRPAPGVTVDLPLFDWRMEFTQDDEGELKLTITASGGDCEALVAAVADFCKPRPNELNYDEPESSDARQEALISKDPCNCRHNPQYTAEQDGELRCNAIQIG